VTTPHADQPLRIAVVGGGIAGLSAAWLLGQRHAVTLYEADGRIGGHAHTVEAPGLKGPVPVDTGFIVYNEANYPNFTALLAHLGVESRDANMALSVSLDDGAFEYSSTALFAQKRNLFSARFWAMLRDVSRFYRQGSKDIAGLATPLASLDDYLTQKGYCQAFRDDHLLPQAAAIWSTPLGAIRDYPAAALIRFFQNHGMMQVFGRGRWRTVAGGSRAYVGALAQAFRGEVRTGARVVSIRRDAGGVDIRDSQGGLARYDQVVVAAHADQALALLDDASADERTLLGAFGYSRNLAVLHTDPALMPRRKVAWESWNHIGRRDQPEAGCVTYWMNRLQSLKDAPNLFVTLNPTREIAPGAVVHTDVYDHPLFDARAIAAQEDLWSLQGTRRTWFCGSYFGHGFHEDALQSGLAAAEALGGVRRPWTVAGESGRIHLGPAPGECLAAA
jgi:predicted NAD/FAD-binding protein